MVDTTYIGDNQPRLAASPQECSNNAKVSAAGSQRHAYRGHEAMATAAGAGLPAHGVATDRAGTGTGCTYKHHDTIEKSATHAQSAVNSLTVTPAYSYICIPYESKEATQKVKHCGAALPYGHVRMLRSAATLSPCASCATLRRTVGVRTKAG